MARRSRHGRPLTRSSDFTGHALFARRCGDLPPSELPPSSLILILPPDKRRHSAIGSLSPGTTRRHLDRRHVFFSFPPITASSTTAASSRLPTMASKIKAILGCMVCWTRLVLAFGFLVCIGWSYIFDEKPTKDEEELRKGFLTVALTLKGALQQRQKKLKSDSCKAIIDLDLVALSQAKLKHFLSDWFLPYIGFVAITSVWWLFEEKLNKVASRLSKRSDDLEMQPV